MFGPDWKFISISAHVPRRTYPKGRFSLLARLFEGAGSYEGEIVWPLDSLSNRDEVPNKELRLRRVDANADQRLLETACQTSVARSRSTHHFDNALPHRCYLGIIQLLADQL